MTDISRRAIMGCGGAAGLGLLLAPAVLRGATPEPVATCAQGRLRGVVEKNVLSFRGIPYGGAVSVPEHRFRAPPPPPAWSGERDATRYGAPAIQPGNGAPGEPAPSEDCLFLNVWTPAADGARRPVMFYSHGGGFTVGSGSRNGQNGANLARLYDVVVVESNHRLGLMGYLYLGELLGADYAGNQGLLDLQAALGWVNRNIAGFGGDPDNVMIFGESGGGGKTTCLYAMPGAAPFFTKASIESPIGPEDRTPAQAAAAARDLMTALGLTDPRQLLTVPPARLLAYQTGGADAATPGMRPAAGARTAPPGFDRVFWPFIDGTILPEMPFGTAAPAISATKPLIVGGCKDEAVFFHLGDTPAFSLDEAGLKARLQPRYGDRTDGLIAAFRAARPGASPSQLYMAIETASPWRAHAIDLAEKKVRQGRAPVYSYILHYQSPNVVPGTDYPVGSPHAIDIATKFANVGDGPAGHGGGGPLGDASPARQKAAASMSAFWANFARTGRPSAPGQPAWKPYDLARRETMLIDAQCRLVSDPEGAERRFWQSQPAPARIG